MFDRFFIYAKPRLTDIKPSSVYVLNQDLVQSQNFNFLIKGKPFYDIRSVYLSSSNTRMFDGITFYNPFSAVKKLSADNVGFQGIKLPLFSYNENCISFQFPQTPKASGFVDVIVENEAGYGKLTVGSRLPFEKTFEGAIDIQKPCVSGIKVIDLEDYFGEYFIMTSDDKEILESQFSQNIIAEFYS
jgi:hypothetical protein